MTTVIPETPSIVSQILELWPAASAAGAASLAWVTANWRAKKLEQSKTQEVIAALREKAHQMELELAQIRAVLSAATGLKFEQITLDMVRDMVSRNMVTIKELEQFILTMPRLMWIKRREAPGLFRMVQVSQVYADKYLGGPANLYAGRTDAEIWPPDIASAFAVNDEAAYLSSSVLEINERVISPLTGVRGYFKGSKWSFKLNGYYYVCGLGVHEPSGEAI